MPRKPKVLNEEQAATLRELSKMYRKHAELTQALNRTFARAYEQRVPIRQAAAKLGLNPSSVIRRYKRTSKIN